MKPVYFTPLIFLLCTSFGLSQSRQDSSQVLLSRYNQILSELKLDTIHGEISALYTKGYRIRAKTVRSLLKNCSLYYERLFPDVVFNPQVLILDSVAWMEVANGIPNSLGVYGLPDAEPAVNKIFIAAEKKSVARLVGLEDFLPDSILSPFDYIALHELGHIFLHTYEHIQTHKKWADEFLASYFALCYLKQLNDSLGLPQIDDTGWQPKYRSLASFEQLYEDVGPTNYAWYQGKFQKLATGLYPRFNVRLLKIFIANYSPGGDIPDPLDLLKRIAPDITNQWLIEMSAADSR
jgi:hypothetical protein